MPKADKRKIAGETRTVKRRRETEPSSGLKETIHKEDSRREMEHLQAKAAEPPKRGLTGWQKFGIGYAASYAVAGVHLARKFHKWGLL